MKERSEIRVVCLVWYTLTIYSYQHICPVFIALIPSLWVQSRGGILGLLHVQSSLNLPSEVVLQQPVGEDESGLYENPEERRVVVHANIQCEDVFQRST